MVKRKSEDQKQYESKFVVYDGGVTRITRTRTITSCRSCYRRKVKCDKTKPACSQCNAMNISCEYMQSPGSAQHKDDHSHEAAVKVENTARPEREAVKNEIGVFTVDVDNGAPRYANMAYWGTIFGDEPLIGGLLEPTIKCCSIQNRSPRSAEHVLGQAARYMPDKASADMCLQLYLRSVQPFFPIFDRQYLIDQYKLFWSSYKHERSFPQFTCIIFTICYCACLAKGEELLFHPNEPKLRTTNEYQAEMDKFLKGAELSIRSCGFPARPSIIPLAAACIMQAVIHRVSTIDNTSEIAQLVRVAQLMGLYRDATVFKNLKLTPAELKLRRTLWFHLMCMDISGSLHNGLPPTILQDSHDVKLPSEDEGLDQDRMAQIYANGKYESLNLLGKLMHEIYGLRKVTSAQFDELVKETTRFELKIHQRIEKIQSFKFEERHPEISLATLKGLQKLFCSSFELLCSRIFCLLYHPSFACWNMKRTELIRAAMKVLRLYDSTSELPHLVSYLWYIRFGRPLHSFVLLLRDIYQRPDDYVHEIGREVEGIDGRILTVEKGIAESEYLQLHTLSSQAAEQWKLLLRVKDFVWNSLPPERILKARAMIPARLRFATGLEQLEKDTKEGGNRLGGDAGDTSESVSPNNSNVSCDDTPHTVASDSSVASGEAGESGMATVSEIEAPVILDFPDLTGLTSDDMVQQLLNLDSWNIDWNNLGIDGI
ncbi:hypothetical protein BZA70DRAFT_273492 [Myxozyma melibiosi]|uniref:Zn(2)-C6 fungal-type domain-containing protein n=1 Tax=Myxozyma melibiosi TaxID=54550 RepID=A0ABR1FEQ4_9ASCO